MIMSMFNILVKGPILQILVSKKIETDVKTWEEIVKYYQ
jgi:hypothetical protein